MSLTQKVRIVLQARTSSTRLPAKALLPLKGIPLSVLSSQRLNKGKYDFVLATSEDRSDDFLCEVCKSYNINFYRGDLHDVQKRFVDCTKDLDSEDLIVRVTADNPFPDEKFIQKLLEIYKFRNLKYLGTNSPNDGLAYGLSAEIFTVELLRDSYMNSKDSNDSEHVTPSIKLNFESGFLKKTELTKEDFSNFSCTIDTLDDYLKIAMIFESIEDPINIAWNSLIQKLKDS